MSAPYTIRPFGGPNYFENSLRCGPGEHPCAICGKPIKPDAKVNWVVVIDGGGKWGDDDSDTSDPGYMGSWPVGAYCHRKYRNREVA